MYQGRGLIPDAHVRTMPVEKTDVSADDAALPVHVVEQSLTVDARCLNDAVDPFRHGIVHRLMVFRNADGDVMFPEYLHIDVTAILYVLRPAVCSVAIWPQIFLIRMLKYSST